MTEIVRLNQSWDAIATSSVITPEQYSSVVDSFGLHYQKFLGYQADDELIWWKEAVGGQFALNNPKTSPWSHPLTRMGLVGASSLAATLLVGFVLSEDTTRQPAFTYREGVPPSQPNFSQTPTPTALAYSISPSLPSVEFSNSSAAPSRQESLPSVVVPRFPRRTSAWSLPQTNLVPIDEALDLQIRQPSVPQAFSPSPAPEESMVPTQTTQTDQLQSDASSPEMANASRSSMLQVLTQLPSLEQADLHTIDNSGRSLNSPTQPTASSPTVQPADLTPTDALPLPQATADHEPNRPPSASANSFAPTTPSSTLSVDRLSSQSSSESGQEAVAIPSRKTAAFSVEGSREFMQISSGAEWSIDPSIAFKSSVSSPEVLTYPMFGSTIQRISQLFAPNLNPETHDLTKPVSLAIAPPNASTLSLLNASASPNDIGDFLSVETISLLPLTQQAASDIHDAKQINNFRILQLSPAHYEIAWSALHGAIATLPPTPQYGFIDYQRQIIVVPQVS